MSEIKVPRTIEDLDPARLEALIQVMHPGTSVTGCHFKEARRRGEMVSTAGRVKLRLEYGPGSPDLPRDVLLKMCIEGDVSAPVLYETETQVYHRVLPGLTIERPLCLAAAYDEQSAAFVLMLEDLSAKDAFFPNVLEPPLSPAKVGELLDLLAVLHARYWNSPDLDAMSGWLSSLTQGRQFEFFDRNAPLAIQHYVDTIPYRADLITRIGRSPARLWQNVKSVHAWQERHLPVTFQHGDTGAHNTYHLPDGRCGYLDWQLSVRGHWSHDVHYLVTTALSVADRRENERALVERYLARLAALGVADLPTIEEAMREFGRALIWGFAIGWLMVPPQNYPASIVTANLERLLAAVMDHGTFALADEVSPPPA